MEGIKLHTLQTGRRGHRLTAITLAALLLTALVGVVGSAPAGAVEQTAVINFESGLTAGDTPDTLFAGRGITGADLGTVTVVGFNPDVAGNSAMIFDATCGGQTVAPADPAFDPAMCSDDDPDLYVPSAGNVAIISEDGNSTVPDDALRTDTLLTLDFTNWGEGTVTVDSFGVADIDFGQSGANAKFYDAAGGVLSVIPIPEIGDNAATLMGAGVSGVASMTVALKGSGAIDLITITADSPLIDVELSKDVAPAAVQVGDETTFTVGLVNQGPDDATGVVVEDRLPAGLTYVSHSGDGSFDPVTGLWTIGNAPVGVAFTLEFVVTVDEVGEFTNVAEVIAHNEDDIDSTPDNDIITEDDQDDAVVVATVEPPPLIDLELTKDVDERFVSVDDEATFTITVVNQGPDEATGVTVTDTLPVGLTYVSDTAGAAYDSATGVWTIGDLALGASVSMDFVVTVDDVGIFTNVAEVSTANEKDIDSTPGNGVVTEDDWDDAIVEASQVKASSTIGDFVWFDDNKDGIQDPGEDGVPSVSVRLTNQATNEVLTKVTNADGLYLFSGLDAGTYLVQVVASTFPDSYGLTTVGSYTVTVLDDESFLDADFGIATILPVTGMEVESIALIGLALLAMGAALLGTERWRRRQLGAIAA
jgi:uncharacterized repeat protein (TIGR01451 family)